MPYTYKGSHDTYLKYAASTPKLDPAVLVPYLAPGDQASRPRADPVGHRISALPAGAAGQLARSCDRGPRSAGTASPAATTARRRTTARDKQRPHDERYDVADEFADVVTRLWEAWEPDAVVLDREKPMFADGSKVHPIHHEGKYFKVPRAAERAALAAGTGADLPGRRLAARPGNSPRAGPTRSSPKAAAASSR